MKHILQFDSFNESDVPASQRLYVIQRYNATDDDRDGEMMYVNGASHVGDNWYWDDLTDSLSKATTFTFEIATEVANSLNSKVPSTGVDREVDYIVTDVTNHRGLLQGKKFGI